ncbi:hypothetical protein [Microvirgula aerodenitrificans]|uniref:hypothetical protein n=1 Tax=Microvirgula aerodenitrificans TaxID=57480 RepID=UPI002F40E78E
MPTGAGAVQGIVTGGYGQKARLFSKVGKEVVEAGAAAGRAEKVFLEVGSTREIKLANGFFQAEGAPFKFSEYYYRRLWLTGRGSPFIQAEEVLKTATTVSPDSKAGFYKYTNGFMEMVYNPITK